MCWVVTVTSVLRVKTFILFIYFFHNKDLLGATKSGYESNPANHGSHDRQKR